MAACPQDEPEDVLKFPTAGGTIKCTSSSFSLENLRFSSDGQHTRMHPNEDRVNITSVVPKDGKAERRSVLFSVLDGHDGGYAVEQFQSCLPQCLKEKLSTGAAAQHFTKLVESAFLQADQKFFDGLQEQIHRRKEITRLLEVCSVPMDSFSVLWSSPMNQMLL